MKCAKDKCKYYSHHLYQASYRTCELEGVSFGQDSNKVCNIDKVINRKTKVLEKLKNYSDYIKSL